MVSLCSPRFFLLFNGVHFDVPLTRLWSCLPSQLRGGALILEHFQLRRKRSTNYFDLKSLSYSEQFIFFEVNTFSRTYYSHWTSFFFFTQVWTLKKSRTKKHIGERKLWFWELDAVEVEKKLKIIHRCAENLVNYFLVTFFFPLNLETLGPTFKSRRYSLVTRDEDVMKHMSRRIGILVWIGVIFIQIHPGRWMNHKWTVRFMWDVWLVWSLHGLNTG